jgi:hypothetical protein
LLSYNPFDLLYCFEVLNSTSFQCLFKCSHGLVKETWCFVFTLWTVDRKTI